MDPWVVCVYVGLWEVLGFLAFVASPLMVHPGCVSHPHIFLVFGLCLKPFVQVALASL